jgi:hypothetical protein
MKEDQNDAKLLKQDIFLIRVKLFPIKPEVQTK